MSTHALHWIACDVSRCDQTTAEYDAATRIEARDNAKHLGWRRSGNRDICERHDDYSPSELTWDQP